MHMHGFRPRARLDRLILAQLYSLLKEKAIIIREPYTLHIEYLVGDSILNLTLSLVMSLVVLGPLCKSKRERDIEGQQWF